MSSRALQLIDNLLSFVDSHSGSPRTQMSQEQQSSKLYDESKDNVSSKAYDNLKGGFCLEKTETRAKNRFKGKVIIVTGGAGNFGIRCAERFASEGANVALWDIVDSTKVRDRLIKEYSIVCESYKVDVTKEDVVNNNTKAVVQKFGRIDYLFNNAGYQGDFKKTHEYSVNDFRKVIDINLTGVFIVLKAVSNAMIAQKPQGGSIVNTASMAGIGTPPNMIAYASSKAAVIHLTKISAKDLAPFNIRVNSVSPAFIGPGFMWTRQIELQASSNCVYFDKDPNKVAQSFINSVPMKRYGSLDEVIGPVAFLLSDDATYLTGNDIPIIGGF